MTAPAPVDPAPPQPPLPDAVGSPPVVDGIDDLSSMPSDAPSSPTPTSLPASMSLSAPIPADSADLPDSANPTDPANSAQLVREADLAAFAELFARFQTRVEKAAAGRKHRPLRTAWELAAAEILRAPDRIHLHATSEYVIEALRLGCESGKVVVVDACLDCIHRLFEYGHIGSPGESSDVALDIREGALDELVAMVCSCLEVKDEDIYMRMVQTLLTAATRTRSGLHHGTLLAAVRTIYNIFLNASTPSTRTTARVSLTQILNLVFARMEAETAEDVLAIPTPFAPSKVDQIPGVEDAAPAVDVPEPAPPAEDGGDASSEFATVLQKDSYLLFRALCKLSAKDVPDGLAAGNVALRSKLLSLELLRNLVNNSGPAFRSGDRFVYALRQYLAPSLLTNGMSNAPEVMDVAFDIFEMLLRKETLRPLLKTEIGALFDTVIFRFLESPTAGPMRKRRAITLLNRVSGDRQTMADLFLNYDCDLDSAKIFERIVNVLSAAAQDKSYSAPEATAVASAPGNGQVDTRILALTSVNQVVRSLRNWSKPIEDSKEQQRITEVPAGQPDQEISPVLTTNGGLEHATASPVSTADDVEPEDAVITRSKSAMRGKMANSGGLVLGTVSEGSDRDTTRFEEAIKARRDMAEGITLFNTKPKRGIEHLISSGRLKRDPHSIAGFLAKAENLDAAMVGEYLGEGDAFNVSVMHAYTDMNDFSNLTFDASLRLHLSGFRLPGEAQKIDRIMEKFASRYCACNPDTFANADAAYVLAYSTIMLHTDAHNDTIKNKMSKEDFIKNNRGINDGGDLDPAFLGALYDRIRKTEIRLTGSLKDSTPGANANALDGAAGAAAMDPAQRARKFTEESERLMAQTKVLFANKRRTAQDYTYYSATNVYHARLMFDSAWYPVLAAVSLNLEEAPPTATNVVALCLDGFRNGIAVASTFGMSTAKDALVSSLAKFTHLNSISEMRLKNVECVRMILAIAALEGNNLGEQWVVIVRAISQLEQIRAVASGNPGKFLLQKTPLAAVSVTNGHRLNNGEGNGYSRTVSGSSSISESENSLTSARASGSQYGRTSSGRLTSNLSDGLSRMDVVFQKVDPKAASLASTISESEIERIFTNSSKLTAAGVADFCGALCTVALEELSETPSPRLFCLQKIVEMAYYNMESRTRIQWGKIWLQMGPFFTSAMCHANRDVAMYSIDALRQLASKFLDKDELSNFAFQKAFLKPFELCFSKSKSAQIRELVLTCVSQIVLARAANIKSGWKSVFAVLASAADDKVESIMNFGWQIVDSIVRKYVGVLDDVYVDAVSGISAYTRSSVSTPVSLAAIGMLTGRCASSLADGQALSVLREHVRQQDQDEGGIEKKQGIWFSADEDSHIGAWFPILTGLAAAMQDERPSVRLAANDGLYKVLTDHGGRFAPSLWALIFRGVLAPIFDDVRHLSASSNRNEAAAVGEWATTTGSASLKALVAVFVCHIDVTRSLLGDLFALVRSWILQETEAVAREGMSVFAILVMSAGDVLNAEDWDVVVKEIGALFLDTMPHDILGPERQTSIRVSNTEAPNGKAVDVNGVSEDTQVNGGKEEDVEDVPENGVEEEGKSDREKKANGQMDSEKEDLIKVDGSASRKIDFRVVRAKCVVQLLLIQLVQEIVVSFYNVLSTENILALAGSLENSYSFAHDFNADIELRYSLWRAGFMNQVPNLLKQETNGLMAYLRIVFWLYLDPSRTGSTEERVMELCESVLRGYIDTCIDAQSKSEERREVVALSPVVCFIVNGMMQMSDSQFEEHLPNLYSILLDLLEGADDAEVRHTVISLFRARVGPQLVKERASKVVRKGTDGRANVIVAQPQLPGKMRECIVYTKLSDNGGQTCSEICGALSKVGGVRSVTIWSEDEDAFLVVSAAPDEMLVAGAVSLPFVRCAFVGAAPDVALD